MYDATASMPSAYLSCAALRSFAESYSAPSRPPHITKVLAPRRPARSTLRSTLRRPYRRTRRSLEVNAPSLKIGWVNVLVVTISTSMPVSASASVKRARIRSRSASLLPNGTTSSSWKVTYDAPSSASRWTDSTGSRSGRDASPNWSRAGHPTVQRPNENLSSRVGVRTIVGSSLSRICCMDELIDHSGVGSSRGRRPERSTGALEGAAARPGAGGPAAQPARPQPQPRPA